MNHLKAVVISPTILTPLLVAIIYILSGICQPLLMTLCKQAGLADSSAQLYMLFYYLGPTLVIFPTFLHQWTCSYCKRRRSPLQPVEHTHTSGGVNTTVVIKASMVAVFDIIAQTFNYTGASYAGATIFAMIYSSVTIWTAIFSRCILHRNITYVQCIAIGIVFIGLCITSLNSISLGPDVVRGTIYILIGSCMHGATYVFSEAIMMTTHVLPNHSSSTTTERSSIIPPTTVSTVDDEDNDRSPPPKRDLLTYMENSAIQGMVACFGLLSWEIIYTIPHWNELIREPTHSAGTTLLYGINILLSFSLANLFHSLSFYYTVAHFPGGSTSAGIMKGLQAVLVFVAAHFLYCHKNENSNNDTSMCFSSIKLISLITVVGGVVLYRFGGLDPISKSGYTSIQNNDPYTDD